MRMPVNISCISIRVILLFSLLLLSRKPKSCNIATIFLLAREYPPVVSKIWNNVFFCCEISLIVCPLTWVAPFCAATQSSFRQFRFSRKKTKFRATKGRITLFWIVGSIVVELCVSRSRLKRIDRSPTFEYTSFSIDR